MKTGVIALALAAALIFVLSGFARHNRTQTLLKSDAIGKAETKQYLKIPAYRQEVQRYMSEDPS
jgi:hypothetical protein